MAAIRIADLLKSGNPGDSTILRGWVRTKRAQKALCFINVNDGSCMSGVQIVAESEMADYEAVMGEITTGASVEIAGTVVESPAKGQRIEVKAEQI
ncbi:MAG: OB-fold nucleic acid binding domain-containing protein, partial [Cyanobacteria bacterium P01_C01_bin.147]